MSDLGAVGTKAQLVDSMSISQVSIGYIRNIVETGQVGVGIVHPLRMTTYENGFQLANNMMGGGVWAADGNPAPSFKVARPGVGLKILWPVKAGSRTFSIDVKYYRKDNGIVALTPRVRVRANRACGVNTDVTVSAASGHEGAYAALATWQTVSVPVTVVSDGVLEVWLENVDEGMSVRVLWDNAVSS